MLNRLITVILTAQLLAACTAETPFRATYDMLAAQTPWTLEKDGRETRSFSLPGGIDISQTRKAGKVSSLEMDNSGHGAVMCAWEIYSSILAWAELCQAEDLEWIGTVSGGLDRINDFIVANSLDGVSKQTLEARLARILAPIREKRPTFSPQDLARVCRANTTGQMFTHIKNRGRPTFQTDLDNLLSVPRLPVFAPCL